MAHLRLCRYLRPREGCSGIFAALSYFRLVKEYFNVVSPKDTHCTVVCDSKAALQRVAQLHYSHFGTTWRCRANYDLEAAIREYLEQNIASIQWKWVRGHATRRKQPQDFTWDEQLNVEADALATAAREHQCLQKMDHWPEQKVSVVGPRGRITGRLSNEIRFCCTAPDLESYWQTRFNWTKSQVQIIDTTGTAAAASKLHPALRSRVQKLRCGWLPVNSRESRSDPDRFPGCSACSNTNLVVETVDHIFTCTNTTRRQAIRERFAVFDLRFREMNTANILITAIKTGTLAWIEGIDTPPVESLALPSTPLGQLVAQAYKEQTSLGWNVFFRGFWTKTWRVAQELEFQRLICRDRQDNGERWAGRAQLWFYDLFELIWGLRNADEHGSDAESMQSIRRTKCERAIRRLYLRGADLPPLEQHPFRDPIEDLLSQTIVNQELWITKTEAYLPKAFQRALARPRGQTSLTQFFAWVPR